MDEVKQSIDRLNKWVEKNGWSGYDPYDIRGIQPFLFLQKNRYSDSISNLFLDSFPLLLRKVFGVKKQINAKAMALFARGYLRLYKKSGRDDYLKKASTCLKWLEQNPSKGYSGFCWGYPFHWQSRVLIPRGTPSVVVTSISAHAFLDAYDALKNKNYLRIAESSCNFILNDLNKHYEDKDKVCFSYTPVDKFRVHNANLFAASTLLRTYTHSKEIQHRIMGVKAVNFTVSYQNGDGSWYYWAEPGTTYHNVIDNLHTGFVLECLNICRRALRNQFEHTHALRAALEFYAKKLFLQGTIPKMKHDSTYPIDIHSCAQAIITFFELSDFEHGYLQVAKRIANWTIRNMQDKEGYFCYRIYRNYVDKTPYIRWGEAWMMRGLSYIV